MSHSRQRHYDSGRLTYDDEREDYHDRDRAYSQNYDRERDPTGWRERRDGSYSPRSRDRAYQDNTPRHDSRDRLSPPYRRLERSRSPYYPSNDIRPPRRNSSRSPSPDSRHYRRSSPYGRDPERQSRRQYYDRDAPERYDDRGPYYGQPSRDIMLEGIGGDMTDHDVATLLPFAV
ncbi:hypothetical protein TWF225_006327 [Orbilia oligospora]|nr:hypothetical protein TWF751_007840 [Orbilia oligospora]KAF3183184.1 hypothetical protein TWF225_006327 [Orbilia oligospora]